MLSDERPMEDGQWIRKKSGQRFGTLIPTNGIRIENRKLQRSWLY
jgi:hypothetical protein